MDKERKDTINKYLLGVKSRDDFSLDFLYEEISPTIRHIALKYLKNNFDTDDLVQDFCADIYKIANRFRFSTNAFSYLCKVMTRRAINKYKSLNRRRINQIHYVDYKKLCLAAENENISEQNLAVEEAMSKLPETEFAIIQLTYFEQKTVREIAQELKISKSQVSKLKISAIAKMKTELDNNSVDRDEE